MKLLSKKSTAILCLFALGCCGHGKQELIPTTTDGMPTCSVSIPTVNAASAVQSNLAFTAQASEFFASLTDISNWPARWQCGVWSPFHGWLYIVSDITIGISYFLIPLILLFFLSRQKQQRTFKIVLVLFILFILACGLTHFIDAAMFWWPAYRLSALIRFMTGVVSAGTVFALIKVTPVFLQLKSPDVLEKLVFERTKELTDLTTKLQDEIAYRKRMEEDLKIRENQYRSLFESAAVGHLVSDSSGEILMINSRMEEMFGYEHQELIGQTVEVLIPESLRSKHLVHRSHFVSAPKLRHMGEGIDLQAKRKDGSTFPVEISLNHYQTEEGFRITALAIDITQRKHAEKQLIESKEYFRTLIENISDAIVLNDENYRFISQSPSVKKILGYSSEERVGQSTRDSVHPDDLEKFDTIDKKLRANPKLPIPFQYRRLHKDGHYIWIEGVVTNLLREASINAIVSNYRDITERKRSEEEISILREKEAENIVQMTSILNALPASIALLNASGEIIKVNKNWDNLSVQSAFAGRDYPPGDNYPQLVRNKKSSARTDSKQIALAIEKILAGQETFFSTEYPYHEQDDRRWFRLTVTPLEQSRSGVVVMHTDITTQKKSSRQLHLIYEALENSLNAFEIINQAGKHIYVNRAYLNMYGYTSIDEVAGTPASSRSVDPTLPERIRLLLQEQKHVKIEFTARRKYGTTFEMLMTSILSADQDGLPIFISSAIDITERKMYEEKVKEERALLRTLIDNLPDYIYVKDTKSRHLINNKANLKLMGATTEEETLGKTAYDIFGPVIAQSFLEDDQKVFKTGIAVTDREETTITSSGELKYLLTTKVPLKDKNNRVTGLVGISRDITKQKQVELDLRNSNYFLEMAQKVGQIGHWISELEPKKLKWSKETCNIFGLDPDEFDQKEITFYQFVHPDDLDKVVRASAEAIEKHMPYSIDHRIILKDGTIKWVHEQGEANFNDEGKATFLIGIVQDITDGKKIEKEILSLNADLEKRVLIRTAQLHEANKEMEAFTYSVSHDLRAPLRIIDGYARILIEDYLTQLDDEGQKTLGVIMTNAKKMGSLIDDLLNFSRIGRVELRKVTVDMNSVLEEVIQDLQLGGMNIPKKLLILPLKKAECDPNLIRHVWTNLISNAVKYSSAKKEPAIEVGMIEEQGGPTYYVKDNGAGFDMQYYDKLFGVFQRLHRHEEFPGTGVGLAIVHRIITRHEGTVWADAKVDEGATFYFNLKS